MKRKQTVFLLSVLAASVSAAMAEEAVSLDSVVVTGRRIEARLEETPQRIEVISQETIARTPGRALIDTLKKNSSLDVIQYPGNLSGIGIRGFRPEYSGINKHSLLLIDGRPAMSTNLSLINTHQLERIEVLKGPASALYGSSAMGGVINLITKESRGALRGYGEIGYGSYDTKELKGGVGGAINEVFDFDYSGSFFDQGDDFKAGKGILREHTSYAQQSHALRLGANINRDWRLTLKTDFYRGRDIASPGSIADGLNSQNTKDADRKGAELSLTGKMGDHRLTTRTFAGEESDMSYQNTSKYAADQAYLPFRSYFSDTRWRGVQVQDAWAWGDTASLVFGIDYEKAEEASRSYDRTGQRQAPYWADSERETTGVYAENTWYLNDNDSTVYLGVRRDKISSTTLATPYKTGFTPSTADFYNTSPSAGFKHLLGNGFRLHGTAGKGFVAPDAVKVTGTSTSTYKGVTTTAQGNPALLPESSVTVDLGLEWRRANYFVDFTVFHTKVKDKIANRVTATSATTNLSTYYNASEAVMRGLEWEGRWQANRAVQLSVSGTHYFERRERNGDDWVAVRNVPRNTVLAAVDVDYGAWSGRLGVRHVGYWLDNNWTGNSAQIIRYDSFTTGDLSVRYRLDKKQSVLVNIENLTDRYYEQKGGYPLPGRNGKISYRYDF